MDTRHILAEWSFSTFIGNASGSTQSSISVMLTICGIGMLLTSAFMLYRKITDPFGSGTSYVGITGALLIGGMLAIAPSQLISGMASDTASSMDGSAGATATPSTSASTTASPSPTTASPSATAASTSSGSSFNPLWVLAVCAVFLTLVALVLLVHRSVSAQRTKKAAARAARERIEREWAKARAIHKKMTDNLMRAETDWDWLFSMPLLTDPSVRQTADFYRAMGDLNRTDDAVPVWLDAEPDIWAQPYPKACAKAQRCWDDAFAHAKKVGLKNIPLAERRLVEKVKRLLSLAEDPSASENERALAYTQAMAVLEKLTSFSIPEKALAGLEASHRRLLTAQ